MNENTSKKSEHENSNETSIKEDFVNLYGISHGEKYKKMNPPKPWQDFMAQQDIIIDDVKWNIAVISDGAGSSKHSEIASKFCCNELIALCSDYIISHKWLNKANLPTDEDWNNSATYLFEQARKRLIKLAEDKEFSLLDLQCTLSVVIRTPKGFLSSSIGDTRSGYVIGHNAFPLIVPFQTFTVGATKFIASNDFKAFLKSKVHTIDISTVDYYVLSTDGCSFFWNTEGIAKEENGIYNAVHTDAYYDANIIDIKKLTPVIDHFKQKFKGESDNAIVEFKNYLNTGKLNEVDTDFTEWLNNSIEGQDDKAIFIFFKK